MLHFSNALFSTATVNYVTEVSNLHRELSEVTRFQTKSCKQKIYCKDRKYTYDVTKSCNYSPVFTGRKFI